MPQVTEFRSWTLSSNVQIFIKSRSLNLLPKAWTKWKKLLAVSLKTSSPFFDKFLQAFRLNLILSVILLSVLVICSVTNSIFSMIFLSSCITNCFKPSIPKESKKKISGFGSILSILHQCVPGWLKLSIWAMINGYFPSFSESIAAWLIN